MSDDALALSCAEAMYARDLAARALGIRMGRVQAGRAELSMTVRPDMLNGHAICHGGYIFALADTAFAYACNSRNQVNVAQGASIDFVSPARGGDELLAVARQLHQGGRAGLYEVTVRTAAGLDIAHFRGRSYRVSGEVLAGPAS